MITPYRHLLPFRASSSANRRLSIEQTRYIRLSYRFIIKKVGILHLTFILATNENNCRVIFCQVARFPNDDVQALKYAIETRANIRIRIRRRIIRVKVSETVIRAVIRITAQVRTVSLDNLLYLQRYNIFKELQKSCGYSIQSTSHHDSFYAK